jgi:hypothetical protein
MKRIVTVVAVLGLAVSACGSDDDAGSDTSSEDTAESVEASSEETTEPESTGDAAADDSSDDAEASDEAQETAEDAADQASGDTDEDSDEANAAEGGSSVDSGAIRSIDDIPAVCRDQMTEFLREVEPIVSTIDWQTATFADFEAIADEFESKSSEFEERNLVAGCDELDFVDNNEFELMIEFAEDQAPGTVGFLQFLNQINPTGGSGSGDGEEDAGNGTGTGFADCQEAIDFVQGLIDDYGTFTAVPASELMRFSSLATIYTTCSPDQLEFFNSPEVAEFLG